MPLDPPVRDGYLLLTTTARLVQRRFNEALAPLGLTRATVIALKAMSHRPINQEQLAAMVHVKAKPWAPSCCDSKRTAWSRGHETHKTAASSSW